MGPRVLAVVLSLLFAFAGLVMVFFLTEGVNDVRCEEVYDDDEALEEALEDPDADCIEIGEPVQIAANVLGWPSVLAAFLALPLSIYFAATGRRGRLVAAAMVVALVLGGAAIGITYLDADVI